MAVAKRFSHRWEQVGPGKWVCRYCKLTREMSLRMGKVGRPLFSRQGGSASSSAVGEKLPSCVTPEEAGQTGLLDPERYE